jgi:hypothetical protein
LKASPGTVSGIASTSETDHGVAAVTDASFALGHPVAVLAHSASRVTSGEQFEPGASSVSLLGFGTCGWDAVVWQVVPLPDKDGCGVLAEKAAGQVGCAGS